MYLCVERRLHLAAVPLNASQLRPRASVNNGETL